MRKRLIWGPQRNRVGAQIDPQIDQVAPKLLILNFMGVPFLGPDLLMYFAHPLAHFWFQLLSFHPRWYHFHCVSLLLAPTFAPNAGPTSF